MRGKERPERKYYRVGGSVNGPIFKDKTFFLGAIEFQNDNVAQESTMFVPTALQRIGDFSELLGGSSPTIIYNPYDRVGPGQVFSLGTCPSSNVCRNPFAGNKITPGFIKSYALNYLAMYPMPNLPVENGVGRFVSDMNLIRPYRSFLGRVDHNFNSNHKIFGKYYYSRSQEDR
jgi:hypothetical protein